MKHSTNNTTPDSMLDNYCDEEREVAEILLQIPQLDFNFSDLITHTLPFLWGSKRKRSALNLTPSPSPPPPPLSHIHDTVPFLPTLSCINGERPIINAETTCTATTLYCFLPCELDAKPMQPKKKSSKKRTKAELLQEVAELTQRRDVLQREVENVKCYYKKLKVTHSELKARQRKSTLKKAMIAKEATESTVELATFGLQDHQQRPINIIHQPPLVIDQTVQEHEIFEKFQNPYSQMAPLSHQPSTIFDRTALDPRIFGNFQYPYTQTRPLVDGHEGAVSNVGSSSN